MMTSQSGLMLVREIAPLIYGAVGRGVVRAVGAEDVAELAQDCLAMAAMQLDAAERNGKKFTPGTIAYFVLKSAKSGRRSTGAGRTDALSVGAQLDGRVAIQSMDAPVGVDDEDCGELTLHDALAAPGEDVAVEAGRHLDWDSVRLDGRQESILTGTVAGVPVLAMAERHRVSPPRIVQIRQRAGARIREAWGTNGLEHVAVQPEWKRGMRALSERRAGRARRAA